MAVIDIEFRPESLKKCVSVKVVIPDPKRLDTSLDKYKVVYALHGVGENSSSFLYKSNIVRYVENRNIILVIPDGDRSMYQDDYLGQKYLTFITEELPQYLYKVFKISTSKNDTWIMGFSMGGYGAVRVALLNSDKYKGFASFSGLLDLRPLAVSRRAEMESDFPFFKSALEDMDNTPLNPCNLINEKTKELIGYISSGTNDDLLICNKLFEKEAKLKCMPWLFSYKEGYGHSWEFWDKEFICFFDYIEAING